MSLPIFDRVRADPETVARQLAFRAAGRVRRLGAPASGKLLDALADRDFARLVTRWPAHELLAGGATAGASYGNPTHNAAADAALGHIHPAAPWLSQR